MDGDGNIDLFRHPESRYIQFRLRLASASKPFLEWLYEELENHLDIGGGWITRTRGAYYLAFGRADSVKISEFMYYDGAYPFLERKWRLAHGHVAKLVHASVLGTDGAIHGSSSLPVPTDIPAE